MKPPWPEQRAKLGSTAIPGKVPEAGKEGAKAQSGHTFPEVYARGDRPFQDLGEALQIRRMLMTDSEEAGMGSAGELTSRGDGERGDSPEDLEVMETGTGGDRGGGNGLGSDGGGGRRGSG